MAAEDRRDEDEQQTLRVTDRRRFTETGEARDDDAAPESAAAATEPEPASSAPADPPEAEEPSPGVPPPASGELGIATVFLAFWQGALMNLGAEDPSGQRMPVNLEAARESIELLRVLQAKTAGNLSEDEDRMLRHLLHEAQMAYVQVAGGAPGGKTT